MIIKIVCAQNGNNSSIRQTVFKSLGLIVLIQICGWLINLIGRLAVVNLELEMKDFITQCLVCLISFSTNSEVIVLYYTRLAIHQ